MTNRSNDAAPTSFRTTVCPYCGAEVPDASFCGACGAHLTHAHGRGAARRAHAYSAFPDEGVLRFAVVSSLFPQLAGGSRGAYRVAFGLITVILAAMAVAGLQAPLVAVSSLAIPLLFLIYVFEIDPLEVRFALPTAIMFVAGAALGAGWGLLLGPVVSNSLVPALVAPLTTPAVLVSAVAVPVIGQLLMLLPLALARLWRPEHSEALDGFTAGVAGALGLTMAATLAELAPLLRAGNFIRGSSIIANVTAAVIRGISLPLVAAAATGYIAAVLWSRRGTGSAAGGRWLVRPLPALAVAFTVEIGLGFADDAGLPDAVLLIVHLAAAALALLALRIGLHYVLLHEERDVRIGPPRVCPHCHRIVPAMPFCPMCGVAERATAVNPLPLIRARNRRRPSPAGDAIPAAGPGTQPGAADGTAGAVITAPPVTGELPQHAAAFPDARPEQLAGIRHLGHRRVLAILVGCLGLATALLVALAFVLPPAPTTPCTSLQCFRPFGVPAHLPHVYTSSQGWNVQWYPARAVFSREPPTTSASTSANQLRLTFTNPAAPAEDGQLAFVGESASGRSAEEIVTALQQANAPNAVPDYVLPGASIGYMPGGGEAFQTTPNSADGNPVKFEVVIICAIRNNYAICAYAVGPQVNLNTIVNHPTESKLALSLWADPDINGVRWKGESQP